MSNSNTGTIEEVAVQNPTLDPMRGGPFNYAVIGCGQLAVRRHIANIAASDDLVLHTCCDVSDERLALCRDKFGAKHLSKDYHATLADPQVEAVVLATTANLRLPIIEAAAKAGKPIYVEKPLANTLEELYAIRDVVHKAKIPFCIGHNRRSSPAMIDAHRIFRAHMDNPKTPVWRPNKDADKRPQTQYADGVAGMTVRINDDWYSYKGWGFDAKVNPHGKLLTEMTHFTDITNWFLASEPQEVVALKEGLFNASATFRYKTGEMATIVFCCNGSFGYPKECFEIFGHGAAMVIDQMIETRIAGIEGVPYTLKYPFIDDRFPDIGAEGGLSGFLAKHRAAAEAIAAGGDPWLIVSCESDKGHRWAVERFAREVRGCGPMVNGIDDAVRCTRMAFAAVKAAVERRVVSMDEV